MNKILSFLKEHWIFSAVLIVLGIIFLTTLGKVPLWDWDECLYAGYAESMKLSHNVLTNYWNGQAILDKLPFYTVLLQTPLLFSDSEFALRMVNVVATFVLLLFIYFFTTVRFSKRVGIFSILFLLTGEVLVRYFTKISTDIPFTLFIFLGYIVFTSRFSTRKRGLIAGFAFALATLVKGFGVLPFLLSMGLIALLFEQQSKIKLLVWLGIGFFVLVTPWLLVEYSIYGEKFIHVYFWENIVQRSRYPIEFHFGGRLFYIKSILREWFPWVLIGFGGLISILKKERKTIELLICIIVPFFFLTLAKTKIEWYAAPLYPFIAIYLAYSLDLIFKKFKVHQVAILFIAILIALDGFYLVIKENKFFVKNVTDDSRIAIAKQARMQPESELNYLVQFSERQAKDILNPTLYTSFTWIYGGNACAHYYSKKRVRYFYSVSDFSLRLKRGNGLFLIQNGDLNRLKGYKVTVVSKNSDFTLFKL